MTGTKFFDTPKPFSGYSSFFDVLAAHGAQRKPAAHYTQQACPQQQPQATQSAHYTPQQPDTQQAGAGHSSHTRHAERGTGRSSPHKGRDADTIPLEDRARPDRQRSRRDKRQQQGQAISAAPVPGNRAAAGHPTGEGHPTPHPGAQGREREKRGKNFGETYMGAIT